MPQALGHLARDWLQASARSPHTVRAYLAEVDRLERFLARRGGRLELLAAATLTTFWQELQRGDLHSGQGQPSPSSINQSRRIVSAFLRWLAADGHIPGTSLAALRHWRQPHASSSPLGSRREVGRTFPVKYLLDVADLDTAAAALCFWAGATPSELAALSSEHVDHSGSTVTLTRRGKRRTAAIPIGLATALKTLANEPRPWVFRAGPLPPSAAAMSQRIARWLRRHKIRGCESATALRMQFERQALTAGWTHDQVRAQLRRTLLPLPPVSPPSPRQLSALVHAMQ